MCIVCVTPISMYVSLKNDNYRKPNKGMFELLKTQFNTKNMLPI